MVVVPVVFLFILLRGIIIYVVMCIILSHALLSIVICDWIWIYHNRPLVTDRNVTRILGYTKPIPFIAPAIK